MLHYTRISNLSHSHNYSRQKKKLLTEIAVYCEIQSKNIPEIKSNVIFCNDRRLKHFVMQVYRNFYEIQNQSLILVARKI